MAILAALVGFCYLIKGFTNRHLVERVGGLLESSYTCRQATYDLRRLKRKGLITKVARSRRYQLTDPRASSDSFLKPHSPLFSIPAPPPQTSQL